MNTYDVLRHLADSWGLVAMAGIFLTLCLWPFRPGARGDHRAAATSILKDDSDGE